MRLGGNPRVWGPLRTRKRRENRGRSRLGRLERLLSCQERILGCTERILGCRELPGTDSGLQGADSGLSQKGSGLPGADSGLPGTDSEHAWNGFWAAWPTRTAFRAAGDSELSESGRKHRSKTPFDRTKLESASFGPADSVHGYARVHTSYIIRRFARANLMRVQEVRRVGGSDPPPPSRLDPTESGRIS